MKIKEEKFRKIIKEAFYNCLKEDSFALKLSPEENNSTINEMARINVKEPQGSIFPYDMFNVHIWSNDHEPAHFHIITDDWDVEFYINTGELYKIKKIGKNKKILSYISENVGKWLQSPCVILPTITNQQNANLQWIQLHPPK